MNLCRPCSMDRSLGRVTASISRPRSPSFRGPHTSTTVPKGLATSPAGRHRAARPDHRGRAPAEGITTWEPSVGGKEDHARSSLSPSPKGKTVTVDISR